MPFVEFSDRDLLKSTIVEPAWYRVKIESVGEAPSKDGGSTNYPVEGTILFNGDTGDVKFRNVPLTWNFNSKAIGFAIGFLEAFGVTPKAGQRVDLAAAQGGEIDVFVENDTYNNRMMNRVNHKYRAPKPEVTAAA